MYSLYEKMVLNHFLRFFCSYFDTVNSIYNNNYWKNGSEDTLSFNSRNRLSKTRGILTLMFLEKLQSLNVLISGNRIKFY